MSSPMVCPNCKSMIGTSRLTNPQTKEVTKIERYCIGGCGWRELVEYQTVRIHQKERE
jgi:hypothetical protein